MEQIGILNGETNLIEYKETLPSNSLSYLKTVVAFANGRGGKIIFGIEDKTLKVLGMNNDKVFETIDSITNAISDVCSPGIIPEISLKTVNGKTIIIVEIERGKQKPYCIKSLGLDKGVFIRVAGTTRAADNSMIKELILEGSLKTFDKEICYDLTITDKEIKLLCENLYSSAKELLADKSNNIKIKKVSKNQLLSWGILANIHGKTFPTNSFALLVGNPLFTPKIQCAFFKNDSRTVFTDKREFAGSIFKQLNDCYKYVLEKINLGAEINGIARIDKYELPPEAIREVIANAVFHRNYQNKGNIQVAIYPNRLEVTSPGGLMYNLSVDKIKNGISQIRNEAIASAFRYMNIVEEWGSGIPRIITLCKEYGLEEPEFIDLETAFRVNIFRKTASDKHKTANNITEKLFIDLIKQNPKITLNKAAIEINVSLSTIKRLASKLQEDGIIKKLGNNRSGKWVCLK